MTQHGQHHQDVELDERFMQEALAEARLAAAEGEVPIGAVVVCDGRVVARAHNRREQDNDPSAHAEFAAMVSAAQKLGRWRLTGCTVYVTLEPCLMCAGLMVNARVDRCVYGTADPKGGATGSLYDVSADARLNHAFEVTSGVLESACAEVLQSFFAERRAGAEQRAEAQRRADGPRASTEQTGERNTPVGEQAKAKHAKQTAPATREPHACGAYFRRQRPHIVLAVDSFKGSASSAQAEDWLEEGILRAAPDATVVKLPIADGGEGTLDAVQAARGETPQHVTVRGPLASTIEASYLLCADNTASTNSVGNPSPTASAGKGAGTPIAIIEIAQAAGITLSPRTHRAALSASSYGVGELVLAALEQGAQRIYLGLGGSATTDGGAGMLQALGARVLDATGAPVQPGLRGLRDAAEIDLEPARRHLVDTHAELIALTDVRNPLVGTRGSVYVFGPQKGLASDAETDTERAAALATCDNWMRAYAARLTAARDALDGTPLAVAAAGKRAKSLAAVPGAGAAGGLGAAALALGGTLVPGIDTILDLANFDKHVQDADLVVTGEGAIDSQTASGKAPAGVAQRSHAAARRAHVVAVCGSRADDLRAVYQSGIDLVLPVLREPMALEQALTPEETRRNLICAGETIARLLTWQK